VVPRPDLGPAWPGCAFVGGGAATVDGRRCQRSRPARAARWRRRLTTTTARGMVGRRRGSCSWCRWPCLWAMVAWRWWGLLCASFRVCGVVDGAPATLLHDDCSPAPPWWWGWGSAGACWWCHGAASSRAGLLLVVVSQRRWSAGVCHGRGCVANMVLPGVSFHRCR
jgi:hypothetical protein